MKNNYSNIQTNEKLDTRKIALLDDNSLLKCCPNFWEDWDFEKNNELGFDIYKITRGSGVKINWICLKCRSRYASQVYVRVNGSNCPYCSGRKVNHTNSLASLNPNLSSEWHPTKNGEMTPYDVTCNSNKKVWWQCIIDDGHEWMSTIDNRNNKGNGCPYCSKTNRRLSDINRLSENHKELSEQWHPLKNGDITPYDVSISSITKYWWLGRCGHEWEASIHNRRCGDGCPYCAKYNKKILVGFNDLWTTKPDIAELLVNSEDGYKHSKSTNTPLEFKCSHCGDNAGFKLLSNIKNNDIRCNKCKATTSKGEHFVKEVLRYMGIEFIFDKRLEWSDNKRYDFYIPSKKCIIEVHGSQHFEKCFYNTRGRSLESEKENDNLKRELAINNGVLYYYELDARDTSFDALKREIFKCEVLHLYAIRDSELARIYSKSDNKLKEICYAWSNDASKCVEETSNITGYNKKTVVKYLKIGSQVGMVDYQSTLISKK